MSSWIAFGCDSAEQADGTDETVVSSEAFERYMYSHRLLKAPERPSESVAAILKQDIEFTTAMFCPSKPPVEKETKIVWEDRIPPIATKALADEVRDESSGITMLDQESERALTVESPPVLVPSVVVAGNPRVFDPPGVRNPKPSDYASSDGSISIRGNDPPGVKRTLSWHHFLCRSQKHDDLDFDDVIKDDDITFPDGLAVIGETENVSVITGGEDQASLLPPKLGSSAKPPGDARSKGYFKFHVLKKPKKLFRRRSGGTLGAM